MNPNLPEISTPQDEELTLRDLLSRLREYAAEIRRCWLTVALICLPFLVWQGYLAFTTPVVYPAALTFMVDDDTGGGAGLINSLLGDIGLGTRENNNDKITELAKSMRIMRKVLFQKAEVGGQTDYLANHFIRIQKLHEEEWYKKPKSPGQPSLNGFLFARDSFEQFSRLEYAAFKSIYGILLGDEKHTPLFSTRTNQDSGIMSLALSTRSEELTIALLRAIFDQLSAFYILSSTEKQQATFDIIQAKADSIRQLLTGTERRAAQFREQNNLLLRPTDQLPTERMGREKGMYTLMYAEALKNLELADFALRNKVPYIQPIDLPIPPIAPAPYGKKKALLLGLGLGLFVGGLFVVGRKLVREQMN